jgi:phage gp29-like protein
LPVVEPEDTDALVKAVEKLVPLGLKVSQKHMRSKLSIPDPDGNDELLAAPSQQEKTALNRQQTALNAQQEKSPHDNGDDMDELVDDLIDWEPQMTGLTNPIQQLLDECDTAEEFEERLPELMQRMDNSDLVEGLAVAFFKSRALGNGQQ